MPEERILLSASDVAQLLNIKVSRAYYIIKKLNDMLKLEGYYIVRGHIPKAYLYKKLCLDGTWLVEQKGV